MALDQTRDGDVVVLTWNDDENRYRKFKFVVAALILLLIGIVVGAGVGIYYLVRWLF